MKNIFLLSLLCLGVAACSSERVSNFPSYKLTVQQGNELDPQAIDALVPGMSRAQVQMLLGTPLLQDPFHAERWDYPFVTTRNGVVLKRSTLSLTFDGDSLSNIAGDAINEAQSATDKATQDAQDAARQAAEDAANQQKKPQSKPKKKGKAS